MFVDFGLISLLLVAAHLLRSRLRILQDLYLPASLLHYMSTRGKDRVMFATDYPVLSFERCLGEAAALDLTDEVRQGWLYDNANVFFFGGK